MENFYNELKKLLILKESDKYVLDSNQYIQLRYFIDSLSQNNRFTTISKNKFQFIDNNSGYQSDKKCIDFNIIYDILFLKFDDNNIINGFVNELIKENPNIYRVFNQLRNRDYHEYIKLMQTSNDFSIDNDRLKFQYIDVSSMVGSYIMLLDDNIYLENLDELRVRKGLRELTNLGNIKKHQDRIVDKINEDLSFESCYIS